MLRCVAETTIEEPEIERGTWFIQNAGSGADAADLALRALADLPSTPEQIEKLKILKLYLLISMDDPLKRVTIEVDRIIEAICEEGANPQLAKTYRLILWQSADKATQESRWEEAITWFKLSMRLTVEDAVDAKNAGMFSSTYVGIPPALFNLRLAIVRRKMAICYLELKRFSEAYECLDFQAYVLLKQCSPHDAGHDETFKAEVDWLHQTTWNMALAALTAGHTEVSCNAYQLTADVLCLVEETLQNLQARKIWYAVIEGGASGDTKIDGQE
ncbi:hypothetical protein HKX48_006532 [Thoreauomyces humboldtii]|nr:hypothetical protein HKX48_006532 [Thoreauomyces humboldtii]